nr:hypothetical protein [Tanacetum cinerariifolium]
MSSASSAVIYTSVYTDSELERVFWGADEELSDGGSPRVIVYVYDGLPMLPIAPPSPDYIPGFEEPQTPPAPQDEDEHELMFIQPHDPDFSDLEEDPEEYEEDETEDGPVDYHMNGGDDGDDDDGDSSGYNADDEDEDQEDEEEEHLAPADSVVVIPIDELASPPEGTEPIIPPPSTDPATTGARITIRPQTSISLPPKAERRKFMRTNSAVFKATWRKVKWIKKWSKNRYEVGESSTRGQGVDYGFADTVEAEMRHRGIGDVGYGIKDAWIDLAEAVPEMAPTTLEGVNTRVTELAELYENDTQDLYALLEDAQDGRTRISQRVAIDSQRVDLLMGDRRTLQETVWIVEEEAYVAREAWAYSVGQIMAPVTRQGQNPPPPNTDTPPHHMSPESVQAMIDQALLRNSTNGDGSHSLHEDNPRHVQTTRPCFYANFMKCQPLNFKGNEGVVGLTRWIKKMESVF